MHHCVLPRCIRLQLAGRSRVQRFQATFHIAPLLLMLCGLAASTAVADYEFGLDAYKHGDYLTALNEWLSVANSPEGSISPAIQAETLYAIAMLYWTGQGVEQDTVAAAGWLRRAAEMNHAGAQAKLGYLYSSGQGVKQSDFEAFKWFQMAARQGDADAQYNLGVLYREGQGVQRDEDQAMKWFREAAANGDAVSAELVAQSEAKPIPADTVLPPVALATAFLPAAVIPPSAVVPAAVKIVPLSPVQARAPTASKTAPLDLGEAWIMRQDPTDYTIQVIALSQPGKLYVFLELNPHLSPLAIYRQSRYEKPLWVLVQGVYASVELARAAVREFPTSFQKRENLWIRRFEMIQRMVE